MRGSVPSLLAALMLTVAAPAFAALPGLGPLAPAADAGQAPDRLPGQASDQAADPAMPAALEALRAEMAPWLALLRGQPTRAGAAAAGPALVPLGANTTSISLVGFGDVDADGRGDLGVRITTVEPDDAYFDFDSTVEVRSGAQLGDVLFQVPVPAGASVSFMPDLDADGIRELSRTTGTVTSSGLPPVGVGVVFADSYSYAYDLNVDVLSGADREAIGSISHTYGSGWTDASAYGVLTYASAGKSSWGYAFSYLASPSQVLVRDVADGSTSAYASAVAAGAYLDMEDDDATYRIVGLDGAEEQAFEVVGADREPATAFARDLGGDDGLELVVAWLEAPGEVYASSAAGATVHPPAIAHIDVLGASAWSWESEDRHATWQFDAVPVPDVTGDGKADLEVVWLTFDTVTEEIGGFTQLRDGSTGAVVAEQAAADGIGLYVPFGDVDGDGKAEFLAYVFGAEGYALKLVDATLADVWTAQATGMPVNAFDTPFSGATAEIAFEDWTGDGVPDLALWDQEEEDEEGTLTLVDGTDGTTVWDMQAGPALLWLSSMGDVTGAGSHEVVLVTLEGVAGATLQKVLEPWELKDDETIDLSNVTLAVAVHAGESGQRLLRQELRGPTSMPVDSETHVAGYAYDVGDLDGDAWPELAVIVGEGRRMASADPDSDYVLEYDQPSAYVLSLATDSPLLVVGGGANATPDGPGGAGSVLPDPVRDPALEELAKESRKDTPAPALAPAAALLVALALARRRR